MRFWLALSSVLAAGAIVLALPARVVYGGGDGVRLLVDTDPHYHVLRAERMLHGPPGATWRDPWLDWPRGGEVIWPPAFDALVAGFARASGAATRDDVARAAAIVPLLLGLASIAALALAGRRLLGAAAGIAAAALLVLFPAHAEFALLGRVDHHVAEVLLATLVVLSLARGLESDRIDARASLGLAVSVALSFWTWAGSTVALLAPCATAAVARFAGQDEIARRAARTLATGCGLAAVALAASIGLLGPPGALVRSSLTGIGGLHVAIVSGAAAYGAVLAWRSSRPNVPAWARALEVAAAVAIPAVLLLGVWPDLRDGVAHGLVALGAANPWYEGIKEFRPMFLSGYSSLVLDLATARNELGLVPAAAALAIPATLERWRSEPSSRPALLLLSVWTATAVALALARQRFLVYASAPLAASAAFGALWLSRRMAQRIRRPALAGVLGAALVAAALAPAIHGIASVLSGARRVPEEWIEAATWLRRAPNPPGREGVIAPWSLGHLVRYYGDRPVVTSPFGTDLGPGALEDWAKFLFTTDEREAESVLVARRVSLVVLMNPAHEAMALQGFASPALPAPFAVTRSALSGATVVETPRFRDLVASRLYFEDGAGAGSTLEAFRLLWEGASTRPPLPAYEERLKTYELLPGARLRIQGAPAGILAVATVDVTTNTDRSFRWYSARVTDARGEATFRIPYATGSNGAVLASACEVAVGSARNTVEIAEDAVEHGSPVSLSLATASSHAATFSGRARGDTPRGGG